MKSNPELEQWCRKNIPILQAKLDSGATLSPNARQSLRKALSDWIDTGHAEAELWCEPERSEFKRRWQKWCATIRAKVMSGSPIRLEDRREQARNLGIWEQIGEQEAKGWADDKLTRFVQQPTKQPLNIAKAELAFLTDDLDAEREDSYRRGVNTHHCDRTQQQVSEHLREQEAQAKQRLKPWSELTREDYDFSAWVDRIEQCGDDEEKRAILMLGVLYEFARESRKLRGLLTLLSQPKETDDTTRRDSFDGLDSITAERALGRWFPVMLDMAEELAANVPFGKVKSERIDYALFIRGKDEDGKLFRIARHKFEFGRAFWHVPPVAPAFEVHRSIAAGHETLLDWWGESRSEKSECAMEPSKRTFLPDQDGKDCEEVLLVRVNWRDFTNRELGEVFEQLARRYRPQHSSEPRDGTGQRHTVQMKGALNALSAMRLRHEHAPKQARQHFEEVRLAGKQFVRVERKNFQHKALEGVEQFKELMPFAESPSHATSYFDRRTDGVSK